MATIVDNDATPGVPVVTISDAIVDETAREVSFVVTLDRPSNDSVTMNFTTQSATASTGSDFVALTGVLGFAPGETSKTVTVSLIDGTAVESS